MLRREFLVAGGAAVLAGCSSDSDGSAATDTATATDTPTPTPTETQTPTPEPTDTPQPSPEINRLVPITKELPDQNLDQGFTREYRTRNFGQGGEVVFGSNIDIPVHQGSAKYSTQIEVRKDGTEVDEYSGEPENELGIEGDNFSSYRWVSLGESSDWEKGEYTAEYIVRDDVTGVSTTVTRSFSIVTPFGADEVTLADRNIPSEVTAGVPFELSLTFENLSDRSSSVVSAESFRAGETKEEATQREWEQLDYKRRVNIAAGDTTTWRVEDAELSSPGVYQYRLDAVGETYTIDVQEP